MRDLHFDIRGLRLLALLHRDLGLMAAAVLGSWVISIYLVGLLH